MSGTALSSELIHATSIAIGGRAVLLHGRSGTGKSDLAMRLIDRGAVLVSDDYTLVRRAAGRLVATAPAEIAGRIEVRGIGIVPQPPAGDTPIALMLLLDELPERMPAEPLATRPLAGLTVPVLSLAPFEASAPIKVELALARFGLPIEPDAS